MKITLYVLLSLSLRPVEAQLIMWQQILGGSSFEYPQRLLKTDNGFLIAGFTSSTDIPGYHGGFSDFWLAETDSTGNQLWQKTYGGSSSEYLYEILKLNDGFAMAGSTQSNDGNVTVAFGNADFWLVKTDLSGTVSWQKSFGGSNGEIANDLIQTSDGGFLLLGRTSSVDGQIAVNKGQNDIWIVKTDSTGNFQWQVSYGSGSNEEGKSVVQLNDGSFILIADIQANGGDISGHHGAYDTWVAKLSESGNLIWGKAIGGSKDDISSEIIQSSDGNLVITGYSESIDGDLSGIPLAGKADGWIYKMDTSGSIIWQKRYGSYRNEHFFSPAKEIIGHGYLVVGNIVDSIGGVGLIDDAWVLTLDQFGNKIFDEKLGGFRSDYAVDAIPIQIGESVILGFTHSVDGDLSGLTPQMDAWLFRFSQVLISIPDLENNKNSFSVYPVPSNGIFHFYTNVPENIKAITITGLSGKEVFSSNSILTKRQIIDLSDQSSGVYLMVVLFIDNSKSMAKLILQH